MLPGPSAGVGAGPSAQQGDSRWLVDRRAGPRAAVPDKPAVRVRGCLVGGPVDG